MKVFFFQAEDGIRDIGVTGVQTCALPISASATATGSNLASSTGPSSPSSATRQSLASSTHGSPQASISSGTSEMLDRKSVVEGKSVDLGGRRIIKKKKTTCVPRADAYTRQ